MSIAQRSISYKLRKHYQKAGVFGILKVGAGKIWWTLRDMLPKYRRYQMSQEEFDRSRGVVTNQLVYLDDVPVVGSEEVVKNANLYQPVPADALPPLLEKLAIPYEQYTFIDIGSGMGRALLIASDFPFKKIIGVEFAVDLHEVAKQNAKNYRSASQKCKDIELVCMDATQYDVPVEPVVLYLNNPFKEPLMRPFLARVDASMRKQPRELLVLYYNPRLADLVREMLPYLEVVHTSTTSILYRSTLHGARSA